MKFTLSFLTMTLSASVLATPTMVERDLASIKSVISGIGAKVDTLHTSIKSYNGGNTQSIESASDTLVDAINSGTAKVKGTEELDSMSALGLQKPVSDLKDQVQATITDLTGKKQQIVAAGKGGVTLDDLKKQKTAATQFSDTVVSKVPKNLQDIAENLSSGVSNAIQKGIDDFKDAANKKVPKASIDNSSEEGCDCISSGTQVKPTSTSSSLIGSASSSSSAVVSSTTPTPSGASPVFTGAASVNGASGAGAAGAVVLVAMIMGL